MSKLKWDQAGERTFERGVERGVLYPPNGNAVVWNGLTSVTEANDKAAEPIYFDGKKVLDNVTIGDFKGTLSAITYPDEFLELEGHGLVSAGISVADQPPQAFGLSYQTKVGSDLDPGGTGYKIHVLYNVTAIPSDKNYTSISSEPSLTTFEWTISAVPEEIAGFRPTAHIVIDSRYADPTLLAELELYLYGGTTADPKLPIFDDLMETVLSYFLLEIIDNKNGTWTAISNTPGYIIKISNDTYELDDGNVTFIDADTFEISDRRF